MNLKTSKLTIRLELKTNIIEDIYYLIAKIDAIKYSFLITDKLLPQTTKRLSTSTIITSSAASNGLSEKKTWQIYQNSHSKKFTSKIDQETAGYLECLGDIFKNYEKIKISESWILELHQRLFKYSAENSNKGQYRQNHKANHTQPHLIKKEMQELILWFQGALKENKKHPLILLASAVLEYLAIQPFEEGNNRTIQLLTNLMLLKFGYNFTNLVAYEKLLITHKVEYQQALNQSRNKEDISRWLIFFLKIINLQANQSLNTIQKPPIEHLLSSKQQQLWSWAQTIPGGKFTRKQAITKLKFPARTVESIIKKLLAMKKLKRIGAGRAVRYYL